VVRPESDDGALARNAGSAPRARLLDPDGGTRARAVGLLKRLEDDLP
jgi:hypothetical protein